MLTKKTIVLVVVLIVIGIIAFMVREVADNAPTPEDAEASIFVNAATRSSLVVAFDEDADTATITGEGFENVTLEATDAEIGTRFENKDEEVVLWHKGNEVTLWHGTNLAFRGTVDGAASSPVASLTNGTWVWSETRTAAGVVTTPIQAGKFTLTFDAETGEVTGTTDCNGFGGEFMATDQAVTFGSLVATEMACANSQEALFTGGLATVDAYLVTDTNQLVLVQKDAAGAMVFRRQ